MSIAKVVEWLLTPISIIVHAPGSTATPELDETTAERSSSAHCGAALPSVAETIGENSRPASKITSKRGLLIFLLNSISVLKLTQLC